MNKREEVFFQKHQLEKGHNMIYEPAIFKFEIDGITHKYSPDFYCPDCQMFFEVAGTKQAFHQDKFKLKALSIYFPSIKIEVVKPNGDEYNSLIGFEYRSSKLLPMDSYKRKDIELRQSAVSRLREYCADSDHRIDHTHRKTGISLHNIRKYIDARGIPHTKTAKIIHAFLNDVSVPQTTIGKSNGDLDCRTPSPMDGSQQRIGTLKAADFVS